MFKGGEGKNIWQSFLWLAFRSKTAKIQPMGENFHLPPLLHSVCSSCFSQEGGGLPNSLPAISVGSIWIELNALKRRRSQTYG